MDEHDAVEKVAPTPGRGDGERGLVFDLMATIP